MERRPRPLSVESSESIERFTEIPDEFSSLFDLLENGWNHGEREVEASQDFLEGVLLKTVLPVV